MRVVGVVACQFVVENVESEVRREAVTDVFHTQTGDVVDVSSNDSLALTLHKKNGADSQQEHNDDNANPQSVGAMKLLVFDNQFVMFCNKSSVLLVSEINVADASANLLFADRVGSAVVVDPREYTLPKLPLESTNGVSSAP